MLFDSHCHLTDSAFDDDRAEVLLRAREAGVERLVTIASAPPDTEKGITLSRAHPGVWTTAGVHPHEAEEASRESLKRVRALLESPEVVAVGECGLDYHYDHSPRITQRRVLDAQIEMASETGLPLVIHSRSCDADMIEVIGSLPPGVGGVLHCFTGSDELLDVGLENGLHVSFTGLVTFKSFKGAHQVRRVPADRLMIETDSPYLAPVPNRGKRNEPAFVRMVAEAVADLRGVSVEELAKTSAQTAIDFYGIA